MVNGRMIEIIPDIRHLEESLELAGQYGAGFEYNDFMLPQVLDDKEKCRKLIQTYQQIDRDRTKDTLHGAFLDVTVHSTDSLIRKVSRKRVYQSLEIAQELDVRAVVFHTGLIGNYISEAYQTGWLQENENFWRQALRDYPQMEIYMENMFDCNPYGLESIAKALEDVGRFGVCFDYAHAAVFGGAEDIDEWFDVLNPYIRHMHINDNDLLDDLHLAVGDGNIDWEHFFRRLKQCPNDLSILLEMDGIMEQKKSLERIKNYMKNSNEKTV